MLLRWLDTRFGRAAPFSPADLDLVVYDFDGVMTDNRVLFRQDGMESVAANRGDGLGVKMIKALGLEQIILSTEANPVVEARAEKIGVPALYGSADKAAALKEFCSGKGVDLGRVLFVGNDVNDREVMLLVGWRAAPGDAWPSIRRMAHLVTRAGGGGGVVRELAWRLEKAAGRQA